MLETENVPRLTKLDLVTATRRLSIEAESALSPSHMNYFITVTVTPFGHKNPFLLFRQMIDVERDTALTFYSFLISNLLMAYLFHMEKDSSSKIMSNISEAWGRSLERL